MNTKRVVVLIDGQNLFYRLREIKVVEKDINWNSFFNSFLESDDELIRSYWFRPEKIADGFYDSFNIRKNICKKDYPSCLSNFLNDKTKIQKNILDDIETKALKAEKWLQDERTRFTNIQFNYDQLNLDYGNIEFVKKGIVKVNPYLQVYVGEKGVDIALAVKMIALSVEKKCDKIILVSGDFDYSEAIKFVKNNMTKVHIVKFHKGYPPKNRSISRDLAVLADKIIDVFESQIKSNYLKLITTPPHP